MNNISGAKKYALIKSYVEKREQYNVLEKELNALKKEVEQLGLGKHTVKGYEVEVAERSRTGLDTTAIKTELPDIYAKFAKLSTFLTVLTKRV